MAISTKLVGGKLPLCICGRMLVPRPNDWMDPAGLTVTCGNPKCEYYEQRIDPIPRQDTRKPLTVAEHNQSWLDSEKSAADEAKDAARYRFLRAEHCRVDPVAGVSWKRNGERSSSDWCNMIDGEDLDRHIDKAMGK